MKIIRMIDNEKGISVIESVLVICMIGVVMALIGPLFREFMMGQGEEVGFAGKIVENTSEGLDESNLELQIVEGCNPHVSDVTYEECNALN